MKIMIDLDRVVFDCPSISYFLGNLLFAKNNTNRTLKFHLVDTKKAKQAKNNLFFLRSTHVKNFNQINNSVEILKKWNMQGFDIYFVSTRPKLKSLQKVVVEWFEKNDINYNSLIFACTNKAKYCKDKKIDVMIDDTYENCLNAAYKGIIPLWLRTDYNKNHLYDPELVFSVQNWNEIDNYIQFIFDKINNKEIKKEM